MSKNEKTKPLGKYHVVYTASTSDINIGSFDTLKELDTFIQGQADDWDDYVIFQGTQYDASFVIQLNPVHKEKKARCSDDEPDDLPHPAI